jgi:hypothetical protein
MLARSKTSDPNRTRKVVCADPRLIPSAYTQSSTATASTASWLVCSLRLITRNSWLSHLQARNKGALVIGPYGESANQLTDLNSKPSVCPTLNVEGGETASLLNNSELNTSGFRVHTGSVTSHTRTHTHTHTHTRRSVWKCVPVGHLLCCARANKPEPPPQPPYLYFVCLCGSCFVLVHSLVCLLCSIATQSNTHRRIVAPL